MRFPLTALKRDRSGAIAPTVALSLFALVAAGGLAFDYAHLATLDTELQDAADQSALAAASQLDGQPNAMARATAAAQNLVANRALMANYTTDPAVAMQTPTYYVSYDRVNDTYGAVATTDATAKVVKVAVVGRKARYALTPVIGLIDSGVINAEAVASLGTAICKVPPVMMCNPAEPSGNADLSYPFDANSYAGRGLKLVSVGNGPSAWGPGDFGYLDVGSPTANPNVELRQALGWVTAPGDCLGVTGVQTRTGAGTTVTQAINTRFDIYDKANVGNGNNASCPSGGSCPPSINTVKDVIQNGAPNAAGKCGFANNEWQLPTKQYLPTSATADLDLSVAANVPDAMGHPRDKCHAISNNGSCPDGKIGDGAWDRNAYFKVNYNWSSAQWPTFVATGNSPITSSTPSRYKVYQWEIANRGTTIGGKTILANRAYGSGGNPPTAFNQPVCSSLQTPSTTGIVPGGTNVDRRRISTAVLNCQASNVHGGGGTVYPVLKFVEMFLVEPSLARSRTDQNDVYVEIIGETTIGTGSTAGQVVRRDKPYLIR